jgi:hypothetical protein
MLLQSSLTVSEHAATAQNAELEAPLLAIEQCLTDLGEALRERDGDAIELHASALQRALARAVSSFAEAARSGSIPTVLRQRLVLAGGQVAAQREALARATASLDRAIDVLMPNERAGLYSAQGTAQRNLRGGMISA